MFAEYIQAALERAQYKMIEDEEPYFATVSELPGVWASGKTIEECRKDLISVIEGWVLLRLKMGRSIPPIGGIAIRVSTEPVSVVE
jgi:predicted RNase H-like HicB family nuclease